MASVGDISVSISLELDGLKQSIQKVEREIQGLQNEFSETSQSGEKMAGGIKNALAGIAGAFAGSAIAENLKGFVTNLLSVTSETNAMADQYQQVLGKMKSDADKYIGQMANRWGKHPSELQSALMQYNAILKGKGLSEKDAYELSKSILERTVDANAFANEDMASTTDRFMAMIKGEYDSLDTAMVNLSATMMNDVAVKKYGKKFEELSVTQQEQLKVQEAIRQHTSAGVVGQGEREADSYANSVAKLSKTWDEFLATIGTPVINNVSSVLSKLAEIVKSLAEKFNGLSEPMKKFITTTGLITAGITILAGLLAPVIAGFTMMAGAIGIGVGALTGLVAGIAVAITAIVAIGVAIYQNWDAIKEKTIEVWTAVTDWIKNTWTSIKDFASETWTSIKDGVVNTWNAILDYLSNLLTSLVNFFTDTWTNIINGVTSAWTTIIETIKRFGSMIYEASGIKPFVEKAIATFDSFRKKTTEIFELVLTFFKEIWTSIRSFVEPLVTNLVNFIITAWNKLKTFSTDIMTAIKTFISNIWRQISEFLSYTATTIVTTISNGWNSIKAKTTAIFTAIKDFLVGLWNSITDFIRNIVNTIYQTILAVWNQIKDTTSQIFNAVKSEVSNIWTSLKDGVIKIITNLKNDIIKIFTNVKDEALNIWKKFKQSIIDICEDIFDGVSSVFNRIKNAIIHPIQTAVDTVKGLLNGVKDFFSNFSVDIPTPEIPKGKSRSISGYSLEEDSISSYSAPLSGQRYMKPYSATSNDVLNQPSKARTASAGITQNITINSPEPLTPSEVARKTLQGSRRLAMEWGIS